jgi:hypothetical protein
LEVYSHSLRTLHRIDALEFVRELSLHCRRLQLLSLPAFLEPHARRFRDLFDQSPGFVLRFAQVVRTSLGSLYFDADV